MAYRLQLQRLKQGSLGSVSDDSNKFHGPPAVTFLCLFRAHEALARVKLQNSVDPEYLQIALENAQRILVQMANLPGTNWIAKLLYIKKLLAVEQPSLSIQRSDSSGELEEVTLLLNGNGTQTFSAKSQVIHNRGEISGESVARATGRRSDVHPALEPTILENSSDDFLPHSAQAMSESEQEITQALSLYLKAVSWHSRLLLYNWFHSWRDAVFCSQAQRLNSAKGDASDAVYRKKLMSTAFLRFSEAAFKRQRKNQRLDLILSVATRRRRTQLERHFYETWRDRIKTRSLVKARSVAFEAKCRHFQLSVWFKRWRKLAELAATAREYRLWSKRLLLANYLETWRAEVNVCKSSRSRLLRYSQQSRMRLLSSAFYFWKVTSRLKKLEKTYSLDHRVRSAFSNWFHRSKQVTVARALFARTLLRAVFQVWRPLATAKLKFRRQLKAAQNFHGNWMLRQTFSAFREILSSGLRLKRLESKSQAFYRQSREASVVKVWRLQTTLRIRVKRERGRVCQPIFTLWKEARNARLRNLGTAAAHDVNRLFRRLYPLFHKWKDRYKSLRGGLDLMEACSRRQRLDLALRHWSDAWKRSETAAQAARAFFVKKYFGGWRGRLVAQRLKERQRRMVSLLTQQSRQRLNFAMKFWRKRYVRIKQLNSVADSLTPATELVYFKLFQRWKSGWNLRQRSLLVGVALHQMLVKKKAMLIWRDARSRALEHQNKLLKFKQRQDFELGKKCFYDWRFLVIAVQQLHPFAQSFFLRHSSALKSKCFKQWRSLFKAKRVEKLYNVQGSRLLERWRRARKKRYLFIAFHRWLQLSKLRNIQLDTKCVEFAILRLQRRFYRRWQSVKRQRVSQRALADKWRLRNWTNLWIKRSLEVKLGQLMAVKASMRDSLRSSLRKWAEKTKARKKPPHLTSSTKVFNSQRRVLFSQTWARKSSLRKHFYAWYNTCLNKVQDSLAY